MEGRRLSDLPLASGGVSWSLLDEVEFEALNFPLRECFWSVASETVVGEEGSEAGDDERAFEDSFKEEEPGRGVLPRTSCVGEGREVSGMMRRS